MKENSNSHFISSARGNMGSDLKVCLKPTDYLSDVLNVDTYFINVKPNPSSSKQGIFKQNWESAYETNIFLQIICMA